MMKKRCRLNLNHVAKNPEMEFSRMEKRTVKQRGFLLFSTFTVIGELFIMGSIKIDYSRCARNKRSLFSRSPELKIEKLPLQREKLTDSRTEILSNRCIKGEKNSNITKTHKRANKGQNFFIRDTALDKGLKRRNVSRQSWYATRSIRGSP